MIGWCIAGGVLLLFLLILLTPVVFSVNYDDFRDIFMWKVSWLGIPLLCSTGTGLFQRKKKPQEQAKPKKKQKKKPEKPEDAKEKMRRSWDMYWSLIRRVDSAGWDKETVTFLHVILRHRKERIGFMAKSRIARHHLQFLFQTYRPNRQKSQKLRL